VIVIPDDYFEYEPKFGVTKRPVPPLDEIRIVEPTKSISAVPCRSNFSRTFESISLTSGKRFDINCRSHRCEKHREKWASRWGAIISEQIVTTPVSILVNLTTPQWIKPSEISEALRFFIRRFRARYGKTRYLKVVEENKKHTQPHFHFLFICEELVIPPMPNWFIQKQKRLKKKLSWPEPLFEEIKHLWTEALSYAKPDVYFATKTRQSVIWCQPPQGRGERAAQYALGYITGQNQRARGKGEDVSDKWRGRKITFSKNFFDLKTSEIWAGLLQKWFGDKKPEDFGLVFKPGIPKDLRLQWLEKSSSTRTKTRLDLETGEIITQILDGIDVRYRLHLGLNFEANQIPRSEPIIYPIYGYDYLSKDKLFDIDTG
jgi:hypothetical protein